MLEGVERQEQHNEILRVAQEYKEHLQKDILIRCLEFEKLTGLVIQDIDLHRMSIEAFPARESSTQLVDVRVKIEL